METPTKPPIPAKTFIKTVKTVDKVSEISSEKHDICSKKINELSNSDNNVSKMSSEDNEMVETSSNDNSLAIDPSEDNQLVKMSSDDNDIPRDSSEDNKLVKTASDDNITISSSEDNELMKRSSDDNMSFDCSFDDEVKLSPKDDEVSPEENECRKITENDEKRVNSVDNSAVDEMFNKVFGKSVRISDKISEISAEEESDLKTPKEIYPDDKNPFGDEEEEEDKKMRITSPKEDTNQYPDDKNPFGDEDSGVNDEVIYKSVEKKTDSKLQMRRRSSDALNPFGDDDEDIEDDKSYSSPKPKPRHSLNVSTPSSGVPSPTSSVRSRKKRVAPTPPTTSTPGIPQVNSSCSLSSSFAAISGDSSRRDSLISSVSSDFGSSVPNSRTPTPLPRLKVQKSNEKLSHLANNQQNSDQNSSLRSIDSDTDLKKTSMQDLRTKKRPAPPIPAVKRKIKGSLAEIEEELNKIGDQLPEIIKRGKELEDVLMKRLEETSDGQADNGKSDSVMDEFVSTARERCRLARRQKELMYMKREHKLEEIQADIEYQMRCVISKQAAQKTDEDHKREEELLQKLVEIIEERNIIIENMVEDENKEVEEYQRLVSRVTPMKPSISGLNNENKKDDKLLAKHKTIDKNLVKLKDKLKLKDFKEKKKSTNSEKSEKTLKKSDKSVAKSNTSLDKSSENLKTKSKDNSIKHLTLKSTLKPLRKSLGLKSSSGQKSDKKSDKKSSLVSEQTNGSNASISDKK